MIVVENIPEDILSELNDFTDWFFQQEGRKDFKIREFDTPREEAISLAYLKQQQGKKLDGYPACAYGIDFNELTGFDVDKFYPHITEIDTTVRSFICAKHSAIKMYYPAGGYIDWHTNANAYGYNVLFTYSLTGEGAFLYQNPKTKEIVTLHDKPGWNMKVGLYDIHEGSPLWHAAWTDCERMTWGYILDERGWTNLVEEIDMDLTPLVEMYGNLPCFKNRKAGRVQELAVG